jgi:heat shock protein HspQ
MFSNFFRKQEKKKPKPAANGGPASDAMLPLVGEAAPLPGNEMHTHSRNARFGIGQQVKHRVYPFRGIIFDVDPVFANTDEWWDAIPDEIRPHKDQPFYHLLAENDSSFYVAYVSEQNLLPDDNLEPVNHPSIPELFEVDADGELRVRAATSH